MARSVKSKSDKPEYRELRNPTVPYQVRVTGEKALTVTRRCARTAKLIESLSREQNDAFEQINYAFNLITGKLAANIAIYEPDYQPTTGEKGGGRDKIRRDYFEWARDGQRRELFNHAAAIDIIVENKRFRECERNRHKGRHWARRNLVKALDAYCVVKGWSHPRY